MKIHRNKNYGVEFLHFETDDEYNAVVGVGDEQIITTGKFSICLTRNSDRWGKEMQFIIYSPHKKTEVKPRSVNNTDRIELDVSYAEARDLIINLYHLIMENKW